MSTHLLYLSQIRTAIPSMPFETIEQASGQFNDVVAINGEWIFRFPRYREGVTRIMAESRLLETLRGRLPLPIPDPLHQRFDPPVPGLAFMGYKRLPGEPLTRDSLANVTDEWVRNDLASQLAAFLRALHHLPLTPTTPAQPEGKTAPLRSSGGFTTEPLPRTAPLHAILVDPQVHEVRAEWEAMYAQVREKLFPAMRTDARREVSMLFESYLDDRALQTFNPALRHGDFGGSNILWDPAQGRVTAVIDFSYCGLGDPAYDLASVSTLSNDFYLRLVTRYEPDQAALVPMLARARFYRGTFALTEALSGLRDNDAEAYRSGMEDYV